MPCGQNNARQEFSSALDPFFKSYIFCQYPCFDTKLDSNHDHDDEDFMSQSYVALNMCLTVCMA